VNYDAKYEEFSEAIKRVRVPDAFFYIERQSDEQCVVQLKLRNVNDREVWRLKGYLVQDGHFIIFSKSVPLWIPMKEFIRMLGGVWRAAMMHEADEFFLFEDNRVFDPHCEGRLQPVYMEFTDDAGCTMVKA
jgi:hypothetical protein